MMSSNIFVCANKIVMKLVAGIWLSHSGHDLFTRLNHMLCNMSVMRKPAFCICENKDADQLCGNRTADQRFVFSPLLPKSEISSL